MCTTKKCSLCGEEKTLDNFSKDKQAKLGVTSQCKPCRNNQYNAFYKKHPDKVKLKNERSKQKRKDFYDSVTGIQSSTRAHLKRMYNMTVQQYEEMLKKQEDVCAVCGKTETRYRLKRLSVDHCHATGEIRGLLCSNCNHGIGHFKDDPTLLQKAIEYLQK